MIFEVLIVILSIYSALILGNYIPVLIISLLIFSLLILGNCYQEENLYKDISAFVAKSIKLAKEIKNEQGGIALKFLESEKFIDLVRKKIIELEIEDLYDPVLKKTKNGIYIISKYSCEGSLEILKIVFYN